MTLDLYMTPYSPPCILVRMLAKHIGVELNLKFVDKAKKEHLTPEFLKMNPYHKVPTLCDDGFIIFESTAISLYLLNKYAPTSELYPKDVQKRARVDQFLAVVTSCLQPRLTEYYKSSMMLGKKPTKEQFLQFEEFGLQGLESMMGNTPFAVGDEPTLADLSLAAHLGFVIKTSNFNRATLPKLSSLYDRVAARLPYFDETNKEYVEGVTGLSNASK